MATQQFYIVPVLHIPLPNGGFYNVPKYLRHRMNPNASPELANVWYAWNTWLNEDTSIVVATVEPAEDAFLAAQTDVVSIPPLDQAIPNTSVRNRVRNALEAGFVPGNWIQTGMTYRSILRVVLGMYQFHNRVVAIVHRRLFDGSLNLDLTVSQIPVDIRDAMIQTADELGLDYSAITGATTLRQLLKGMGDQFAAHEFVIGGVVI